MRSKVLCLNVYVLRNKVAAGVFSLNCVQVLEYNLYQGLSYNDQCCFPNIEKVLEYSAALPGQENLGQGHFRVAA